MAVLWVKVDAAAGLRPAERLNEPDPVALAVLAELAGARGVTVHLREDRRGIQERDLRLLKEMVRTRLNLEMAPLDEGLKVALAIRPERVTLVPELREGEIPAGGVEVERRRSELAEVVRALQEGGIGVSLLVEPELAEVKAVHRLAADGIDLYAGHFAEARGRAVEAAELEKLTNAAKLGRKVGLAVQAGSGLTYQNVGRVAAIPEIDGLVVGHSILARALLVGIDRAVRDMLQAMGVRGVEGPR